MTIAVTGATGNLGRLTIAALLERGVAAADIVAVVRDAAKAAELAEKGVQVRVADYDDADALRVAFAGVDKLLLVSGSEIGRRVPQHTNVVEAAKATGVGFLAYTSILDAQNSPLMLAAEHKATENLIAESGIAHALLRNGWYWENYESAVGTARETGVLFGAAGTGRVAGAARKDFAEAAAAVLLADDAAGKVYELGGDRLTYAELAEALSGVVGKPIVYKDLSREEYTQVLEGAGVPSQFAAVLADSDAGIAAGALDTDSGDLQRLIGRDATPVADVLRG
ncbi:SDR family oxidoreductase [Rhodococcus sp. HM1]|uniref:SDR family oxidoreductase n=1 Tax=unclassified Rhodococcus (in: high G+C Gram-positive bacteria) TaxID=192944 RepID=UPI0018CF69C4|nr:MULTISPECIES: SDR family oxidoreductase [unclassified Rhodococcus (in: high G+C Gram-positive bacteria)]MBH0122225.1 SDR family oxidoreductase [Rhodococcus sp. CX]MCK8669845.1 SDR family oxidoreductase [Rhodococcus sp. HM1]